MLVVGTVPGDVLCLPSDHRDKPLPGRSQASMATRNRQVGYRCVYQPRKTGLRLCFENIGEAQRAVTLQQNRSHLQDERTCPGTEPN